jgi:hypothetical protein
MKAHAACMIVYALCHVNLTGPLARPNSENFLVNHAARRFEVSSRDRPNVKTAPTRHLVAVVQPPRFERKRSHATAFQEFSFFVICSAAHKERILCHLKHVSDDSVRLLTADLRLLCPAMSMLA